MSYGEPITINNPAPLPAYDYFGSSVSIYGDKVLIGAERDGTSAYLFDATTGALLQTFDNPTSGGYFGSSVSIYGDKVLIGAHWDSTGATKTGSAYLFDVTTGGLLQTINNPTPAQGDLFGRSVSIYGDKALIGAAQDDTVVNTGGFAYLYDTITGALLQTFINPTQMSGDHFSSSVSIYGDKVLIGADGDDTGAANAGSAYLYDATTGALLQTFNNPTPVEYEEFGDSVSIYGDKVLIGAQYDTTGATDAGSAYLYISFLDTDNDGIADDTDNCPADANPDQTDTDGDGEGDVCDTTPNGDTDGDGVDELVDNCPGIYNPGQEDNDGDGIGNVCDPTPDGDPDPDPTSTDQCKQLGWVDFSFRNQGQCVAFVNTGHDSR